MTVAFANTAKGESYLFLHVLINKMSPLDSEGIQDRSKNKVKKWFFAYSLHSFYFHNILLYSFAFRWIEQATGWACRLKNSTGIQSVHICISFVQWWVKQTFLKQSFFRDTSHESIILAYMICLFIIINYDDHFIKTGGSINDLLQLYYV